MHSADLNSFNKGKNLFGYSAYLSIDKAITHAFGLNLQYDLGETNQGLSKINEGSTANSVGAKTKYQTISLIGDINLSNLLRKLTVIYHLDGHYTVMQDLELLLIKHIDKTKVLLLHH